MGLRGQLVRSVNWFDEDDCVGRFWCEGEKEKKERSVGKSICARHSARRIKKLEDPPISCEQERSVFIGSCKKVLPEALLSTWHGRPNGFGAIGNGDHLLDYSLFSLVS